MRDTIYREDAIKCCRNEWEEEVEERLRLLPSAERKRGEWEFSRRDENVYDIRGNKSWANWYRCSNCKFSHEFIENHTGQYNYCPNCGSDMRGNEDEC